MWWNIWLGMLITGILLLILSIVLMVTFHIPDLLDELSGRKAKRQIKKLRELNVGSTGALEGMDTDDVYSIVSTDALVEDFKAIKPSIGSVDESEEADGYEEASTSYMNLEEDDDDEGATNILSDGEKHVVEVIVEQSSL